MIGPVSTASQAAVATAGSGAAVSRSTFRMVRHESSDDRTAGSMPVWGKSATPAESIAQNLSQAGVQNTPGEALAYAPDTGRASEPEEFGFADILDMVNPLQHIPIVGHVYRSVTGDTMKPVAEIVGGSIYGGVTGGAISLANVIVAQETGKDIAGNVLSLATGNGSEDTFAVAANEPERRLNEAVSSGGVAQTPEAALGFVGTAPKTGPVYPRSFKLNE